MKLFVKSISILFVATILNAQELPWVDLFNGKNLSGWRVLNGSADFEVRDGVIVGISKLNTRNTFLATEADYSDFILEYEVKLDNALNSGVQIRSLSIRDYYDGAVHGYQVELDPSPRAWAGGIYDESRRGWLYNLEYNAAAKTAFRHDKWNHFRVEAIGTSIRVWVNGIPTSHLVDDMTNSGFIALQVHGIGNDSSKVGKTVQFRNIRLLTENLNLGKKTGVSAPQVNLVPNELTEVELAAGWQLLWDGESTDGWRGVGEEAFPDAQWRIQDGMLSVIPSSEAGAGENGDIITTSTYTNFELEIDYRITKGANSGIKYIVDPQLVQEKGVAIGCEYQLLDDGNHPDAEQGINGNRSLASLYDLISADGQYHVPTETTRKRGFRYGWNRARIVVDGQHVSHYLNGVKVVEYQRNTQMWNALVATSKYKDFPDFGNHESGFILLQDHGDEVSFRSLKIREIKK